MALGPRRQPPRLDAFWHQYWRIHDALSLLALNNSVV